MLAHIPENNLKEALDDVYLFSKCKYLYLELELEVVCLTGRLD